MTETSVFLNPHFYAWWILCIAQTCVTVWAYLRCFTVKIPKVWIYTLITVSSCVTSVIFKYVLYNFYMLSFLSVALNIIMCMLLTYGSKARILLFFVLNYVIEGLVEITLHILSGDMYDTVYTIDVYGIQKTLGTFTFLVMAFVLKFMMSEIWIKLSHKNNTERISWQFVVFPMAQMTACAPVMIQSIINLNDSALNYSTGIVIAGIIIMAVANMIFLNLISDIEKKKALEQELHELEYTRLIEEEHYESIEAKRYEIAKIRHDIKNQIITMRHLISSGQLSDAEELLDGLESSLDNNAE